MKAIRFISALFIALATFGTLAADDRDDRESLDRYHAAMDSIWDSAFDSAASYRFAAIAYSQSTGKYGYSYNYTNRADAMRRAVAQCKENDARVVGWVENGYCALATGKSHTYGAGHGSTAAKARAAALAECKKHSDDCHIEVCVYSGSAN